MIENNYLNKLPIVSIIIGTRPEAIKLAQVYLTLKLCKKINLRLILTGQHTDLVNQVLNIFEISADNNLNLMKKNQSLEYLTQGIMEGLSDEFKKYPPNLLLVQGDTTTAFVSSLFAFYNKIPIGHLEAGLRTDNLYSPYPEEANRRLISQIATIHFAPTEKAKNNLIINGINKNIFITGNTVIDSLLKTLKTIDKIPKFAKENEKLILVTIHRRENQGEKLKNIATSLKKIINEFSDVRLLLPLHPNPKIRETLIDYLNNEDRINLVEPLDYKSLIAAMNESYLLLTDSGGLQEEAPTLGKPILVLRENTERQEIIESGGGILVGTDSNSILKEVKSLLQNKSKYERMSNISNPYGDGKASKRILEIIKNFLKI